MEIRIDDLAERAGVPTRTIRYYTQQGLLHSPTLRGRVGFYDDRHLDRLKLIKELQEKRYLPLTVIKQLIKASETGLDLETMLTPLDLVFQPRWDAAERREYSRAELARAADVGPAVVDAAEEMGFLFPVKRGQQRRYTSDDLHMLQVAQQWLDLDIPRELGLLYRESLEKISEMQVEAFRRSVVMPLADESLAPEQAQERLVTGFNEMAQVFHRLVDLLHRKVLQKVIESHADDDERAS
ncbi:MAG: MerR family transcriptional regulator [Actinomycetota bacterium]